MHHLEIERNAARREMTKTFKAAMWWLDKIKFRSYMNESSTQEDEHPFSTQASTVCP